MLVRGRAIIASLMQAAVPAAGFTLATGSQVTGMLAAFRMYEAFHFGDLASGTGKDTCTCGVGSNDVSNHLHTPCLS